MSSVIPWLTKYCVLCIADRISCFAPPTPIPPPLLIPINLAYEKMGNCEYIYIFFLVCNLVRVKAMNMAVPIIFYGCSKEHSFLKLLRAVSCSVTYS